MSISILEQYLETGNHIDLEHLLANDASLLQQKTSQNISPLLLACYYQNSQVIQTILKYTTTITIHEACAAGLLQHVQMMLDHKKDIIDEISSHGFTALGIAVHFNQEDIVRLLLLNKANPNIHSQNGQHIFPLHTALSNNNSNISKMLIEAGAEVNIVQHLGQTPIHLAAFHGNIDMIIILLEQGANISSLTEAGESAADMASKKGFREIAEILQIR